jgi:hypothetical protein
LIALYSLYEIRRFSFVLFVDYSDSAEEDNFEYKCPTSSTQQGSSLTRFFDRALKPNEVNDIDQAITDWLFSTGLPFSTTQNAKFKRFVAKLHNGYLQESKLSTWTIRRQFLDARFIQIDKIVQAKIQRAKTICLLSDGWTGHQRKPVVNMLLTTPTPIFLCNFYADTKKADSEFYRDSFLAILADRNVLIRALCTDNASVMRRTWVLMRERQPDLITYGCGAHCLQLLVKDIIKSMTYQPALKTCTSITSYFRTHLKYAGLAELRQVQKELGSKQISLALPVATRWSSELHCVDSIIACKDALQTVVLRASWPKGEVPDQIYEAIVRDEKRFFETLHNIQSVLSPIRRMLLALECDNAGPSDVYASFLHLHASYASNSSKAVLGAHLCKRLRFIFHPVHASALALDARYIFDIDDAVSFFVKPLTELLKYLNMSSSQALPTDSATASTTKLLTEISGYFQALEAAKADVCNDDSCWSSSRRALAPRNWWTMHGSLWPTLKSLASILFQLPATSASCERVWSHSDFIIRKTRTRLTSEYADKLLAVYSNERLFEAKSVPINPIPYSKALVADFPHREVMHFGLIGITHTSLEGITVRSYP